MLKAFLKDGTYTGYFGYNIDEIMYKIKDNLNALDKVSTYKYDQCTSELTLCINGFIPYTYVLNRVKSDLDKSPNRSWNINVKEGDKYVSTELCMLSKSNYKKAVAYYLECALGLDVAENIAVYVEGRKAVAIVQGTPERLFEFKITEGLVL